MEKYIQLNFGGNLYRFLIDEDLDSKLRSLLNEFYQFDEDNVLIVDKYDLETQYKIKQIVLNAILDQLSTYNINSDLHRQINSLKTSINNKTNIYHSDLTNLESRLYEASELYNNTRNNFIRTRKMPTHENLEEAHEHVEILRVVSKAQEEAHIVFSEILDDIGSDSELKEEVPVAEIKESLSRVEVCATLEEYEQKTGESASDISMEDVADKIANTSDKVIVPPTVNKEELAAYVIQKNVTEETYTKVAQFVETKTNYSGSVTNAFNKLRSDIKVAGFSTRNLNYFGDQFIDQFIKICEESGTSFEAMFADYFSYSTKKRYNSPLNKFIVQFIRFNGGDENTRAIFEALLVKKAISKHLISAKYNRYLRSDLQGIQVGRNGYVRFDDASLKGSSRTQMQDGNAIRRGGADLNLGTGVGGVNVQQNTQINQNRSLNINEETQVLNPEAVEAQNKGVVPRTDIKAGGTSSSSDIKTPEEASSSLGDGKGPLVKSDDAGLQGASLKGAVLRQNRRGIVGGVAAQISETEVGASSRPGDIYARGPFTTNQNLNPRFRNGYLMDEDDDATVSEAPSGDLGDSSSPDGDSPLTGDIEGNDSNGDDASDQAENDGYGDTEQQEKKKKLGALIIEFIKKNPWVLVGIGLVFIIILLIFAASQDNQVTGLGYYDAACNYNEATVNLYSCDSAHTLLRTMSIGEYTVKMAYLYTKDSNISDEAMKALMIVIKTNALSYGNYNSIDKQLDIRLCDMYPEGGSDTTDPFFGVDESFEELNNLYETISEYLLISTSYTSSISTLGTQNILDYSSDKLKVFQTKAAEGKDYATILKEVYTSEESNSTPTINNRDTIFIGDSRTQGMLISSLIMESQTVYGVGYGYNWFIGNGSFNNDKTNATGGAISAANSKMSNDSYNIVLWLGVNDLNGGANRYFDKYQELATGEWSNHHLYVVSVGPVDDSKAANVKNEGINQFNSDMASLISASNLSNLTFINLNYTQDSITHYDGAGLHYGKDDYQRIYSIITKNLTNEVVSKEVALYRLTDYCTYYNLTNNTAYWWPVGSAEVMPGTNVYGGEPTALVITSHFGRRNTGIQGASTDHKGIDIAKNGGACGLNIIASRDGVVTTVTDDGGKRGTYVVIDHQDGAQTLYQHMQKGSYTVKVGDTVVQGQKIGLIGNTGVGSGCHLHFEVLINNKPVNPEDYVDPATPRPTNTYNVNISGTNGDTKNMFCSSLLASGFSKEATIGIMANVYHESGYGPMNLQNSYEKKLGYTDASYTLAVDNGTYKNFASDSAGYGLVQWTSSGRKERLYDYIKSKNLSIGSFEGQFQYMLIELEKYYGNTYKYVTGNHTALDIGAYWCDHYESPGGSEPCSKRGNCPSQHCVNRTRNDIANDNITSYVNNGCRN